MALGEAFTVLAVFEAYDKVSKVVEKMNGVLDQYGNTVTRAAEQTVAAGGAIDESLLKTASGADAVQLADAKLSAAQQNLAAATAAQADAERALLDAQAQAAAAADGDAEATGRLVAASKALADAQKQTTIASKEATAAQQHQADVARATASAGSEAAAETDAAAAAQTKLGTEAGKSSGLLGGAQKALKVAGVAAAALGVVSIKAAGDFQSATQHLVTDAGETQSNLKMVQDGILNVATATGTSATQLTDAMYHIESAGFHGAQGLKVLQTAAEGAKVGGADFGTVAKTLTGTMNSYNLSGGQATSMMNQLIAAVGAGDMKMQDLASSLGNVAPLAAAAGISFDQVGGAIATMTAQNMSAQQASQDLANTIRGLSNPNKVAIDEMSAMGIDSNNLAQNLGKNGLTGTLQILTDAVAKHTQGGQVLIDTMKSSTAAAADAKTMMGQLPASVHAAAQGFLDGSVSVTQFNSDIKDLSPQQQTLAKQFETVAKKTDSFNKLLASGSPVAQTFNAAMAKMLGGSTGLNTALMLTGGRMQTFQDNVKTVGDAAAKSGGAVDNWDKIQNTFNQKLAVAKASVEALGIKVGLVLLPYVQKIAGAVAQAASWFAKHAGAAQVLAGVIGGVLVASVVALGSAMFAAFGWLELIAVGIAAAAAGAIYAYNHFRTFHAVIQALGAFLGGAFKAAWKDIGAIIAWFKTDVMPAVKTAVKDVFDWFEAHKADFQAAWDAVVKDIQKIAKWFDDNVLKWIKARIGELVTWWHEHSKEISEVWSTLWKVIGDLVTTAWNGVIKPVLQIIAGFWDFTWDAIKDSFKLVWSVISDAVTAGMHIIEHVVGLVLDIITGNWGKAWSDLSKLVSDAFNDVIKFLTDAVSGFGTLLWDAGANLIKGLIGGIKSAASGISNTVSGIAKSIADFFPHSPAKTGPLSGTGGMDYAGANVGKMLSSGMTSTLPHVQAASKALAAAASFSGSAGFSASYRGAGVAQMAYGPGMGGGTVINNNHFDMRGSSVMGNQAMDQLAQKIGQRIPGHLASGGVKIHM